MSKRVILFKKTPTAKRTGDDSVDGRRLQNYIESYLDQTAKVSCKEGHQFQSERMMPNKGFTNTEFNAQLQQGVGYLPSVDHRDRKLTAWLW